MGVVEVDTWLPLASVIVRVSVERSPPLSVKLMEPFTVVPVPEAGTALGE